MSNACDILALRWLPPAGVVLRQSELGEGWVAALAAFVLVAAVLLAARGKAARLPRGLMMGAGVFLGAMSGLAVLDFHTFVVLCEEDHLVEWLTACFLLAAWVLALAAAIRSARLARPSPMTATLAVAWLWGFCRELEWGEPLFGRKLIYTRNFFRPAAYFDPDYFRQFQDSLGQSDPRPLMQMHWLAAGVAFCIALLLTIYILRHRRTFLAELRRLPRELPGKLLLWGCGLYIGSQLAGKVFGWWLKANYDKAYRRSIGLSDRLLDEPLECVAAACFALSAVAMWNLLRHAGDPPAERL